MTRTKEIIVEMDAHIPYFMGINPNFQGIVFQYNKIMTITKINNQPSFLPYFPPREV